MIILNLKFESFINEEEFIRLQDSFIAKDEVNPSRSFSNKIEDDIIIKLNPVHPEMKELYSFKETLKFNITRLNESYVNKYKEDIEKNKLFSPEQKLAYAKHQLEKLNTWYHSISEVTFLSKDIQTSLLNELENTHEYLSNSFILPSIDESSKIKFNINKTDLIVLFQLLRKHKIIDDYSDAELGRLIESNYLCLDNRSNYKPLTNTRKFLNDIKNGNKTVTKSEERLKDLLANKIDYDVTSY